MTLAAIVIADQRAAGGNGGGNGDTGDDDRGGAEQPLLLSAFRGKPLAAWAIGSASSAELDETIVVTGATDLSSVLPERVTEVHNNRWPEGPATSLHAGLTAATWEGHDGVVVGWADQPLVPASAWISIATTIAPIVVATYGGTRSWPIRLSTEVWALLGHTGHDPVAVLARERPDLVAEVPCPGDPRSFSSRHELASWS
jgi:CTP:molybdopterin cytidylyltransferase MocA